MNKNLSVFLLLSVLIVPSAHAINVAKGQEGVWWGWKGKDTASATSGDFILAGGIGKNGTHGTFDDEWGIVGMIASKIVEHGGYFCPYQLQCANKKKKKKTWTNYYHPNGYSANKCAWLCESGYSGTNCMPAEAKPASCDLKPTNTISDGRFTGVSMKTSGDKTGECELEITGFAQWGKDPECDVILGITKFMEHGVAAAPIQVCCGRDNWKKVDSFVKTVGIAGTEKILCATGYKVNSVGSDCEPISVDMCETQETVFCANFDRNKYDSAIHTLEDTGSCVKYFCSDTSKAFPAVGSADCEDCAMSVKGGPNPNNGVCVTCNTGEYFDKDSGTCKNAAAYSTVDLQYGKGNTKNDNGPNTQCWLQTTPDEYRDCVTASK